MSKYGLPLTTIALGLALNVVGVLSRILSGDDASFTTLIPAFVGGAFLIIGAISFKSSLRMHAIHGALTLALLLGGMTFYMAVKELLNDGSVRKLFAFETTAVLCISYVVIGVRSFLNASKLRKQAGKAVKAAEKAAVAAEV